VGYELWRVEKQSCAEFCSRGLLFARDSRREAQFAARTGQNPEEFWNAPFAARTLLRGANCAVQKWILNCDFCAVVVQFWLFRLSDVI
jgi:hypothetical protein